MRRPRRVAGGGRARHRLRRRRARLPDAGAHRGGGGRRLPRPRPTKCYTPTAGIPALRAEAIAAKTRRGLGLGGGGQPGPHHQRWEAGGGRTRSLVLCDPGDEVLVLAPYWTTYPESIAPAGGRRSWCSSDETTGFRSSVEDLEAAWTPDTKALRFVSPSNPTGAVYTRRGDRGHRPLGGVQVDLGADRRDLRRAPRLWRCRATLDARSGSRAGRPLPGGQRCGEDLRHDRLAGGRLIGPTDAIGAATNIQSYETSNVANQCRNAPSWPPCPAGWRTSPACGRPSTAGARPSRRCSTTSRAWSAWSPTACFYAYPSVKGPLPGRSLRGTTSGEQRGVGRDLHQRSQGGGCASERRSARRATSACPTRWGTRIMVEGVSRLAALFGEAQD